MKNPRGPDGGVIGPRGGSGLARALCLTAEPVLPPDCLMIKAQAAKTWNRDTPCSSGSFDPLFARIHHAHEGYTRSRCTRLVSSDVESAETLLGRAQSKR